MTKKKTVVLIIAAAAVLVYALSIISPEQKIARFVGANADRLYETAEAALSGGGTDAGFSEIKSVDVFPGEHAIVQFIFTGSGIGSETKYYGFYYSPDDAPAAFQNAPATLKPYKEGIWTWNDGSDNGGITKKLADNWYYFEAWF